MGPREILFLELAFIIGILVIAVVRAWILQGRLKDLKNLHKNELAEAALLLERERDIVVKKTAQLEDITLQLEKEEELVAEKEAQFEKVTLLLERERELVAEKDAQLQLRTTQACNSPVSGLPNLVGSQARIDDMFARLERGKIEKISVVAIDLYKFKPINDLYGHKNGDKVLKVAGEILLSVTRSEDIVIHLHGDEFAIICSDIESEEIEEILTRANSTLLEYDFTFIEKGGLNTKYSFGSAESNEKLNSYEKLYHKADLVCMSIKNLKGESR